MKRFISTWNRTSLIKRIAIGVVVGAVLGLLVPKFTVIGLLGDMFVGGLKAIAPLLVFALVANALSQTREGQQSNMKTVIVLYLFGTFAAALTAVISHYIFPISLKLGAAAATKATAPQGVGEVFKDLLLKMVDNPVNALAQANYIGVLVWAVVFGFAMRAASNHTKDLLNTLAEVTSQIVRWIINLAPFGILGLVFNTISENGVGVLADYGVLILVLVGTMAFVALVVNPIIAFVMMGKNPFPLVFRCLKDSGITAFFTRSSAANIPVNLQLCKDLGLNPDTYSVSIPLGIQVDFATALILSVVSAISACGASGIAGGSLLLVPVACSLFGISNDLAMQVVGVGFIVGVIQDSCETALNSSTDVLFTAVAEKSRWKKA